MVTGLVIIILSFVFSRIFEEYTVWIMALGYPIGAFIIFKGREKIGLKNKFFGNDQKLEPTANTKVQKYRVIYNKSEELTARISRFYEKAVQICYELGPLLTPNVRPLKACNVVEKLLQR